MNENLENNVSELAENKTVQKSVPAFSFCGSCGTKLSSGQKFCHNCGAQAIKKEPEVLYDSFVAYTSPEKPKKSFSVIEIVKRSLILAIAILMILAAFLPIIKLDFEDFAFFDFVDEDIEVSFSSIDSIQMFLASLDSIDDEEMEEYLGELIEDAEDYKDEWEDGEELDELSPYVKKMLLVMLRSESVPFSWSLAFVAFFSVAQIILSILLLIFSSISFASIFTNGGRSFTKVPFLLLGLNAVTMFANIYAYKLLFGFKVKMLEVTSIYVCAIVFALLMMLTVVILRILVDKVKIRAGEIVKRSLGVGLAIVLLVSSFAPLVTTAVKTTFSGADSPKRAETTLDGSLFEDMAMSDVDKEELEDTKEEKIDEEIKFNYSLFEGFTKREFIRGEADIINRLVYSNLFLSYGNYVNSELFTLGSVAMMLVFLCALILIWKNLYELATGANLSWGISIPAKVLAIAMAVLAMALAIVTIAVVNYNADVLSISYTASLAYGPILMLISAIGVTSVPGVRAKKEEKPTQIYSGFENSYNHQL